jgi:hypothetical protein
MESATALIVTSQVFVEELPQFRCCYSMPSSLTDGNCIIPKSLLMQYLDLESNLFSGILHIVLFKPNPTFNFPIFGTRLFN